MASSFAFAAPNAVQTNDQLAGNTPQAGVQGGNSQGGVVRANEMTYSDGNDGIPEFLHSLVEPYVKAKQQEKFDEGADAVANGAGVKEIAKSDSGIARVFGPSFYHQGAAMYDSTTKVADLQNKLLADPELFKLPEAERTAKVSEMSRALLTGDTVTDHLIQTGLMTNRPAVMATLAKKNFAYGQVQAVRAASGAADAAGDQYNAIVLQNNGLSSPGDGVQLNVQTATHNFIQSFARPYGMTDESYASFLQNSAINMRGKGNFAGYEALKASGLLNPGGPLSDDQIDRIEKGYDRDASHVLSDAAFDPEVNRALATMSMALTTGGFRSPKEIFDAAEAINARVALKTGMTGKPMISGDDLSAMQKEYASQGFAAFLRVQSRQWQLEDRQAEWAHADDAANAKAAQELAAASGAVATGNVSTALAVGGVHSDDVNAVFQQQFMAGNMAPLVSNFVNSKYVNETVANQVQSSVAASIGVGLTKGFETAHGQWQKLNAANPGAATAYLGSYGAKMLAYDNFLKGGELPLSAYAQSFGKLDDGGRVDLPVGVKQSDAVKQVDSALRADDRWLLGMAGDRTPLAASSLAMMREALLPKAAAFAKQSGVSIGEATAHVRDQMFASGELERSGPFAWTTPLGAKKMSAYLGIPDAAADKLITAVAGKKLKDAGYAAGSHGDNYNVLRAKGPHGEPVLYFQAYAKDGGPHKDVLVTLHDLQAQNRADAAGRVRDATTGARINAKFPGHPVDALVARGLHSMFGGNIDDIGQPVR